jgi:hypothetical protein
MRTCRSLVVDVTRSFVVASLRGGAKEKSRGTTVQCSAMPCNCRDGFEGPVQVPCPLAHGLPCCMGSSDSTVTASACGMY